MTDREHNQWRTQLAERLDAHPINEWSTPLIQAVCAILDVAADRDQPTTPHDRDQAPTPHGRPKLAIVR